MHSLHLVQFFFSHTFTVLPSLSLPLPLLPSPSPSLSPPLSLQSLPLPLSPHSLTCSVLKLSSNGVKAPIFLKRWSLPRPSLLAVRSTLAVVRPRWVSQTVSATRSSDTTPTKRNGHQSQTAQSLALVWSTSWTASPLWEGLTSLLLTHQFHTR